MGYYTDRNGIKNFAPNDTVNDLWIWGEMDMEELMQSITDYFGEDAKLSDFKITPEYIQTSCIGYDLYDPSDYSNFLHITRIDPVVEFEDALKKSRGDGPGK